MFGTKADDAPAFGVVADSSSGGLAQSDEDLQHAVARRDAPPFPSASHTVAVRTLGSVVCVRRLFFRLAAKTPDQPVTL
jgi:hypothetical protein